MKTSSADELLSYSFLVAFANDDAISEGELSMIKRLALSDGTIDAQERAVLRAIFGRANTAHLTLWVANSQSRRDRSLKQSAAVVAERRRFAAPGKAH